MKILLAPDKFKGSLTAQQVCDAVSSGLLDCDSSFEINCKPLADGGEGTSSILTSFSEGKTVTVSVHDPLFRKISAAYGVAADSKTAFIEIASASGLMLLTKQEQNPFHTTSFGTGELVKHALDNGAEHIVIGLGGSATNDAGMGAAEALGVHFFDNENARLLPVGENLLQVNKISITDLHSRAQAVSCTILCDVNNPLHGTEGAAYVYAPQKGADNNAVKMLDAGLKNFEKMLNMHGIDCNYDGAGAAGGFSVMMKAILRVELQNGFDFLAKYTKLEAAVQQADVVITGEGSIDKQTLSGKVLMGVCDLARKHGKPVYAVAGINRLDNLTLEQIGIKGVVSLARDGTDSSNAIKNAFLWLKTYKAIELGSLIKAL